MKNHIQVVLGSELCMRVHGIPALPSVAGICVPLRSTLVIMNIANSFFFLIRIFNVSFLYFYSSIVVDCYADHLKKRLNEKFLYNA